LKYIQDHIPYQIAWTFSTSHPIYSLYCFHSSSSRFY